MQQAFELNDSFFLLYQKKWSAFFSACSLGLVVLVFGVVFIFVSMTVEEETIYLLLAGGVFFSLLGIYVGFLSTKLLDDDVYKSKRVVLYADTKGLKLGLDNFSPLAIFSWSEVKQVIIAEKVIITGAGESGVSPRQIYVVLCKKTFRGKNVLERLRSRKNKMPNGDENLVLEYDKGKQAVIFEQLQRFSANRALLKKHQKIKLDYKKHEIIDCL